MKMTPRRRWPVPVGQDNPRSAEFSARRTGNRTCDSTRPQRVPGVADPFMQAVVAGQPSGGARDEAAWLRESISGLNGTGAGMAAMVVCANAFRARRMCQAWVTTNTDRMPAACRIAALLRAFSQVF